MKTKIVEINCCDECPNLYGDNRCAIFSNKNRQPKRVKDVNSIPKWCPLPSVQEFCESNFNINEEDE